MHDSFTDISKLVIISGYVGYQTIKELASLPKSIEIIVIYGMYGASRISTPLHNALLDANKNIENLTILYSKMPVHSKIYIWENSDNIVKVLTGSANFSISGLMNDYKEVLSDVSELSFKNLNDYYEIIVKHCIPCDSEDVTIGMIPKVPIAAKTHQPFIAKRICRASLLNKDGIVSKKSGLNWGFSSGHVSEGDAYITITKDYIKLFPDLFPAKKYVGIENTKSEGRSNRENDAIELIWDDGEKMRGLLEGQQTIKNSGLIYPKQLSSSPQKSELGKYIRKRIGVPENHLITKSDLKRYGRDSIDISLIGDGIYYMDFSVNK